MGMPTKEPHAVMLPGISDVIQVIDFPYVTLYANPNTFRLVGWQQTADVVENAIPEAIAALDKAYELDPKQGDKIHEQLKRISDFASKQGVALNDIGAFGDASNAFLLSSEVESYPAFGEKPDLTRLYYAGTTAVSGAGKDPSLYERAEQVLNRARELGFTTEKGEIYYYLYHAYNGQVARNAEKLQKAKETIEEGYAKYPDNNDLLGTLIDFYAAHPDMGNATSLIDDLDRRIAEDPNQISFWLSRAQIYSGMKEYDKAVESLNKAIEIDPNSYPAQFFAGYFLAIKAGELGKASTEMQPAEAKIVQEEILDSFRRSIPYLEKAHELNPTHTDPLLVLNQALFRLRTEEGMKEKWDKYTALEKQLKGEVQQ